MTQQRAVHTRDALIRSAAETFERCGYVQAKLAEISSSAGVSAGALHFHFANKAAVASTVETAAADALRGAVRAAQVPGMNAMQRLTAASHALAEALRHDVVARAGFHLSCRTPQRTGPDLRQEWHACVRRLLAAAEAEGLLAEHVRPEDASVPVIAATTGLEVLGDADPRWLSPGALAGFWRFILPCLAKPEVVAALAPEPSDPGSA
ncbi:TetR family transcriptional regulator [Streptomyces sp. G44]|uniref:ScbR family autoregulator-binding transcription factor n=1 Tax=Streptomyces sp. G44 TaxID=2807632 RepID=UPI001960EB37|nr:ScbR family autoregulator-binding transcription factor [Streptomyces sp. G44]MBM7170159.1 TetR family transcriptional regulator [Streptomyces sp. G44]